MTLSADVKPGFWDLADVVYGKNADGTVSIIYKYVVGAEEWFSEVRVDLMDPATILKPLEPLIPDSNQLGLMIQYSLVKRTIGWLKLRVTHLLFYDFGG